MQEGKALLVRGFDGVFDFVKGDLEGFELAPLELGACQLEMHSSSTAEGA